MVKTYLVQIALFFMINGLSVTCTVATDSIDATLEVAVNSSVNCTMDSIEQMFEEEVNELLDQLGCTLNITFNVADSSALSCGGNLYTANISIVSSTEAIALQLEVCQAMDCLHRNDVTGTFFHDNLKSVQLSVENKSLCDDGEVLSPSSVTGSPSNATSELLSVFIRDMIIVAASTGGGSAIVLAAIVTIIFCVKTARYSYRKSRSWTLSNSDMDGQNFIPYSADIDDTSTGKSIPMGRVREGPLPTPPPPDAPRPTERYVNGPVPPPAPPPLPGQSFTTPIPPSAQSSIPPPPPPPMPTSKTNPPPPPSQNPTVMGGTAPPPPPPLPSLVTSKIQSTNSNKPTTTTQNSGKSLAPMLPPTIYSNPVTTAPDTTPTDILASTSFVEEIYDSYDIDDVDNDEEDLHQKTKELENLLASMDGNHYLEGDGQDEYIEVNPPPRRVSNPIATNPLPDYVNFNPTTQGQRESMSHPQDEYVDMSSSFLRDQHFINYTSNEDMYI